MNHLERRLEAIEARLGVQDRPVVIMCVNFSGPPTYLLVGQPPPGMTREAYVKRVLRAQQRPKRKGQAKGSAGRTR